MSTFFSRIRCRLVAVLGSLLINIKLNIWVDRLKVSMCLRVAVTEQQPGPLVLLVLKVFVDGALECFQFHSALCKFRSRRNKFVSAATVLGDSSTIPKIRQISGCLRRRTPKSRARQSKRFQEKDILDGNILGEMRLAFPWLQMKHKSNLMKSVQLSGTHMELYYC